MRGGKNEVNSLCDVIILSLLYWCQGLILFFCLVPFTWVGFSLVFVQMAMGLMLQYTHDSHKYLHKRTLHGGWNRGCFGLVMPFPTFASGLWHTRKPADMSGFHTWAQLNCRTSLVNSPSLHRRPVPSKPGWWWKKMSTGWGGQIAFPSQLLQPRGQLTNMADNISEFTTPGLIKT